VPVVLVGTVWPERYSAWTVAPTPGQPDPYQLHRGVVRLAEVVRVPPVLSRDEQDRAAAVAAADRQVRTALSIPGYGLTQALAAAPQLIERWQDADPYAGAVLTAAVDAARLGVVRSPLRPELLRAAAPGYCTSQQQANAKPNWFEEAIAYATKRLRGAAAALQPVGAGMGELVGYTVADYLLAHASAQRRYQRVPPSTWQALLAHVDDHDDLLRVGNSASRRLLDCYAEPLYRRLADSRDRRPADRLAELLVKQGREVELRARADAGDPQAAYRLAGLLAAQGRLEEVQARADAGDEVAAWSLPVLLAAQGREEVRARVEVVQARWDAGDVRAALGLADLLAAQDRVEEVQTRADAGVSRAALGLADLLAEQGRVEELAARADAGDQDAARRLADLLAAQGDIEALRAQVDAGHPHAGDQFLKLLANRNPREAERIRRFGLDPD
jgi:hypothetical protein